MLRLHAGMHDTHLVSCQPLTPRLTLMLRVQAQTPGPTDHVQDTAFMHEAFLDDATCSQLAIASPTNIYNVRFSEPSS